MGDDGVAGGMAKRARRVLDWRMDPVESRSDFTIEIACELDGSEEEKVATYYVHKNVLEFGGDNSSGYFAGLFASATTESRTNKTQISLQKLAADTFPVILDHLYSLDDGVPQLTIKNAAPVHHLADYLEVDSLRSKVLQFWKNGIEVEDLGMCLDHANTFCIDALQDIVVRECSNKITQIELNSHLMAVADAEFWLALGVEMKNSSKLGMHPHLLSLIAEFCLVRKDRLDAETFSKLTAHAYGDILQLPLDTAMKLLEVERAVLPSAKEPTDLQTCCIAVLASGWNNLMISASSQESFQKLSPTLFSRIMIASFGHAQEENKVLIALHGKPLDSHPTSITVTGAGISAVNGVYSRTAPFNVGVPEYTMNGEWEDQPTTFSLKRWRTVTKKLFWLISIKRKTEVLEVFYTAIPFAENLICKLPRKTGWIAVEDGVKPVPTISYRFD